MDETRTAEEIDADANAKIQAAIAAAIAAGEVDPNEKIGVVVNATTGDIKVGNVENPDAKGDRVEFPPLYSEEGRESMSDTHYTKHNLDHWGF